jgi:alginate O-acetyltransferase complex protein AlgI
VPFHSYAFLFVFLPAALILYRTIVSRPALRTLMLPLTGCVFYSLSAGPARLALLLAMTLVAFGGARLSVASGGRARRAIALGTLLLLLAVLAAFKLGEISGFGAAAAALPLGISFYTFNLVSYGLDVYRQRTPPATSFSSLASFSTFFPTVAAGPLLRFDDFQKQQASPLPFDAGLAEVGLRSLIVGLAKKVLVADPLGVAIEPLFADYERLGLQDAWLAVLGYAYQLYFDFSGYTDMAIGAAALLGFRIPQNFDAPYTALHITDFWQRWHMTMSRWFRDYLFLPLSRGLLRRSPSLEAGAGRVRALCLVFTMVVIGLWHGSTWTFLAWGLFHGLLLAGHAQARVALPLAIPAWASRAITFVAVLVGWVLLRSPSPGMALRIWGAMLGLYGWGESVTGSRAPVVAAVILLLVVTNMRLETRLLHPRRTRIQSWTLAVLLVLSLLSMGGRSQFLYFQF